jgi:hypothetical protein
MRDRTLWIFSPVYHDVACFLRLREEVLQALRGANREFARVVFVVVDDTGGNDPEIQQILALRAVRVVTPPFNLGHQRAIVFALRTLAREVDEADWVLTLDADGEDQPSDVPRLIEALESQDSHPPLMRGDDSFSRLRWIVLARRTKRRETLVFKVLYLCFKTLFLTLTGRRIQTGNFALYRGWTARNLLLHPNFDFSYAASLACLNVKALFVPCERGRRYLGKSKMSYSRLVMHGICMLMPMVGVIATRALMALVLVFLGSSAALALALASRVTGMSAIPYSWIVGSAAALGLSSLLIVNFLLLFAAFQQGQAMFLSQIDRRVSAPPADARDEVRDHAA